MISRLVVIAGFLALAASTVGIEAVSHRAGSRLVPLALLLRTVLSRRSARVAILPFWWWVGWHFLVEP